MKRYIVNLTENISDQLITDFEYFGVNILYGSKLTPSLVTVETNKTIDELENFFLVETAVEAKEMFLD